MLSLDVVERAQVWMQHDPNPTTVQYLQDLLYPASNDEHHVAFCEQRLNSLFPSPANRRLQFGTAGLRGRMQPGPVGMNDLVVIQTAQGLASYVIQEYGLSSAAAAETSNCCDDHNVLGDSSQSPQLKHTDGICALVGYDHRSSVGDPYGVSSLSFAIFTALVFMEAGIDCFLLDGFVPTPLVSYGVLRYVPEQMTRRSKSKGKVNQEQPTAKHGTGITDSREIDSPLTAIGIMITASHNPAKDAGYKVFWTDGCQIRSPTDKIIAASIQENLVPWTDYQKLYNDLKAKFPNDPCLGLSMPRETEKLISAYYQAIWDSGLVTTAPILDQASVEKHGKAMPPIPTLSSFSYSSDKPCIQFCYTAMHGVGHKFVQAAFARFGLPRLVSVPSQEQPDPKFSTVAFPNPEERGALDLAKKYAVEHNCAIVLANDPDADRLGVSEYNPTTKEWTDFTGDQIGLLLGHWLWMQFRNKQGVADIEAHGSGACAQVSMVSMCSSTVSSQALAVMARQEGFHHEETLAGFKWIGSKASELAKSGKYNQMFAYEESLGYCCGNVLFDKDGITACIVLVQLAMHVYSDTTNSSEDGRGSLVQHLQYLYKKYGEFVSDNGYFLLDDPSKIPVIMNHITQGGKFERSRIPKIVGTTNGQDGANGSGKDADFYEISSIRYLGQPGYDSTTVDKKPVLPTSKSSPMVTIRFTNGGVAQFRASGTEPKFKYYLELQGQPGVDRATVREVLKHWKKAVLQEFLPRAEFDLRHPDGNDKED
ncbi:hypothetical protein ACA910_018030 [Epithemia clementina (nom. ined.)]